MTASDGCIALIAPMPDELRPLTRALGLRDGAPVAGRPTWRTTIGATEVVALRTGIGPERAEAATAALLDAVPVAHVVVSGIAGGLPPARVGHLVVPAEVVHGATGARYAATPVDGVAPAGALRTGDVDSYEDGDEAFAAYASEGFSAVDMETAAIARACAARDVPWLAFRAVSDMAGDPGVGPEVMGLVDEEGRPRVGAALRFLVTRPHRIPRMVRLGRDASAAAATAADAAATAVRALAR